MNAKRALSYFAGLLLLLVGVGGFLIWKVFNVESEMPELLMGIFVVTAIAALMTLLYILAAGFKFMGLTDRNQPLGLPDGSIRAMIALILIIAFIIFGFYLYRNVGGGVSFELEKNISADSLKHVNMNKYKDMQTKIVISSDSTFTIMSVQKISDEGSKLAQQLLTTVGTLVVAISSFYFGSNTVSSAIAKATTTDGSSPQTNNKNSPTAPTTPRPDTTPLTKRNEEEEPKTKKKQEDWWTDDTPENILENKPTISKPGAEDDNAGLAIGI
jgi:hypothetical protein